jgi:hypothetical protein
MCVVKFTAGALPANKTLRMQSTAQLQHRKPQSGPSTIFPQDINKWDKKDIYG